MKRILLSLASFPLAAAGLLAQTDSTRAKKDSFLLLGPVEVRATRAGDKAPFTKTNLSREQIERQNLGQDLPFILDQTPSVIVNSDAGNGVGYTGIRIRGTDATRINVTLNGIPYNDAESQGTYFVDLPDFASSVGSIQIQRGVGTSSNGAGAFGATINLSTNESSETPYAELSNSYGSFNTWKNTVKAGSGLVDGHFTTDVRLSRISSDGYIDRASSDLKSFYFSTAYFNKKSSVRLNIISGKEKTYQAWDGVSEENLKAGRRTYNELGTEKPGSPYANQTDNYWQDHYQLFFNHQVSDRLLFTNAVFLTRGKGYYEEYKAAQAYADYGLPSPVYGQDTVQTTDLVRRRWLDNYFYGDIFSLQYKAGISQYTLGGGWTRYDGTHFGDVIWAAGGMPEPSYRYYDMGAFKTDFNLYFKEQRQFARYWNYFYDLQVRRVVYHLDGFEDNPGLIVHKDYSFFNPKVGLTYSRGEWQSYLSFSVAGKEPNRDDYEAGITQQPRPERLYDWELGTQRHRGHASYGITLYYMHYRDQLVLTGRINDVGSYTRTNIPRSYRMGLELQGSLKLSDWMQADANLSLSRNKVLQFTEYVDDYDNGGQKSFHYRSTDIALSPGILGGATLRFWVCPRLELDAISKYVSEQYLDNTQRANRRLAPYYTQDLKGQYTLNRGWLKHAAVIARVNNLFNRKYEPSGYTYSYIYGGSLTTENYYYPMAGTNFMTGITIRL
ncbi:MAG TPA: TonB-dependent receptor plug domain-containing protein [Chitinophagaceae bacterium]|nr:TonB-dependent receptor plug domain-containing protein [Chitinophagaceae bacterium]